MLHGKMRQTQEFKKFDYNQYETQTVGFHVCTAMVVED